MHRIAIPLTRNMPLFELAVPYEVFRANGDNSQAQWWYDVKFCVDSSSPIRTESGLLADTAMDISELARADTVIVTAVADTRDDLPPALLDALRGAFERGARIASICTGAFVLAAAGLLDGRRATTHWRYASELASRWPSVHVEPDVLFTEDGQILTSAGSSAGLDLCLHMVRRDHGTRVANAVARRLVIPPHREGGQAQYIEQPLAIDDSSSLGPVLDWAKTRLEKPLTVEDLARRALMSPRTFARRFRETTGTTPLQWLCFERVRCAQDLLENTNTSIDLIAESCGFGSAQRLRTHFVRINHVTPLEFRRTFRDKAII